MFSLAANGDRLAEGLYLTLIDSFDSSQRQPCINFSFLDLSDNNSLQLSIETLQVAVDELA